MAWVLRPDLFLGTTQILEGLSYPDIVWPLLRLRGDAVRDDSTLRLLRYIDAKIALRHVCELTTVDVFFLFTEGLR